MKKVLIITYYWPPFSSPGVQRWLKFVKYFDQFNIKPIYKSFPGWKSKTQGIRNIKDLPEKAKNYIFSLEDFIGAKISSISTSPEREDTILIEDPFNI